MTHEQRTTVQATLARGCHHKEWSLTVGDPACLPDQHQEIGYACPVCHEVYSTSWGARACRDRPFACDLEIGDLVVVPGAYHNHYHHKGDPWCAFVVPGNPQASSHLDRGPKAVPYFVVTAVHTEDRNKHRAVVTLCNITHNRDLRCGWNPADGKGHFSMFKLGEPVKHSYYKEKIEKFLDKCEPCDILLEQAAELAAVGISTRNLL